MAIKASPANTGLNTSTGPAYQQTVPQATTTAAGGVPTITAQQIMAPTSYTAAQSTVNPTSNAATGYNVATSNAPTSYNAATTNVDTSAASFLQALQSGMAPTDAIAQQQLNEQLAAAGVVGGSAIGATEQLGLQEQAAFQAAAQPGLLTLKGDELSQAQANAASRNAASQFDITSGLNQSEFNTGQQNAESASATQLGVQQAENNANNLLTQSVDNMGATNAASQFGITSGLAEATQNAQNSLTAQENNQGAAVNLGEFNANAANNTSQFNASNLIKAAQGNDATYNQFLEQRQADAEQNYLAQLQSQTQIDTQGQNNQTTALDPVYTQPAASNINFSNLGAAFAPTPTTTQPSQTSYTPTGLAA